MLMKRYDPVLMRGTEDVFRASLYFQALEQKPKDKIYAVGLGAGNKTLFTRHYVSGKSKNGAQKLNGDLEKSCYLASNAGFVSREITTFHSDGYTTNVCRICY